jgi:ABC-type transport system involved in cytochrome c biogenesis permease component
MSLPLLLGCLWVLGAALTALLPMRGQMLPGMTLLLTAPVLILWIGAAHGWIWVLPAVLAFASMFRNPLRYLWARARGQTPDLPPELRR